jgi:nucleoside-diphosphate-sugar epimerase
MDSGMSDRVLVTGASGFIGQYLVKHFLDESTEVAVVSRTRMLPGEPPLACITWAGDASALIDEVCEFSPTTVYHLAAFFLAEHEANQIPALVDANVAFGTVILEAARQVNARVVLTGSAWQHCEGADYRPVSLYAATKQALLDVAEYYVDQGLDVRELTLFDTYGPKDTRKKLVPMLLDAAKSGETLRMSSGRQLIDLLYVTDVVNALVRTAHVPSRDTKAILRFVARSDRPLTIREFVSVMERTIERPIHVEWGARPDRPREMITNWEFGYRVPDWSPVVDLALGIQECWVASQG